MVQEQEPANRLAGAALGRPRREEGSAGCAVDPRSSVKVLLQCADSEVRTSDEPIKTGVQPTVVGVGNGSQMEVRDQPTKLDTPAKVAVGPVCVQPEANDEPLKTGVRQKVVGISDDGERDRAYRQGNWVLSSILILLKAKRKEVDMTAGSKRFVSADEKWKFIEEYCRKHGVQRTKEQCKIKWDNMQPDYRKIKAYEEHRDANTLSYFEMEPLERRIKLLPSNMDGEVYQMIADIHTNKPCRGGGFKKEAREKKFHDLSSMVAANGAAEGSHCNDGGKNIDADADKSLSSFVTKHMVAPPTREYKRRAVEGSVEDSHGECGSTDGSSTEEDDTYVIASRIQPWLASQVHGKNEASLTSQIHAKNEASLTSQMHTKSEVSVRMLSLESKDTLPLSLNTKNEVPLWTPGLDGRDTSLSLNIKNEVPSLRLGLDSSRDTSALSLNLTKEIPLLKLGFETGGISSLSDKDVVDCHLINKRSNEIGAFEAKREKLAIMQGPSRSNGDAALEAKEERCAVMQGPGRSKDDYEMLSYIHDKEDARHKELLALEREKLAVFKEASSAIVNAMNNAAFTFSRIAEELLLRRH